MKKFRYYFLTLLCTVAILFCIGINANNNINDFSVVYADEQSAIEETIKNVSGTWGTSETIEGTVVSYYDLDFYNTITNNVGTNQTINTAEKLATLVYCINNNRELAGYTFVIDTQTFDMKAHVWPGINNSTTSFKGTIIITDSVVKNLIYENGTNAYLLIEETTTASDIITRPSMTGNWTSYATDTNGTAITSLSGNGTQTYPYEIYTNAELAYVAKSSFEGNWFLDTYFEIRDSIDLSGHIWQYLNSETHPFFGTIVFDSDEYTITNTYIKDTFTVNGTPYEVVYKTTDSYSDADTNEKFLSIIDDTQFMSDIETDNYHSLFNYMGLPEESTEKQDMITSILSYQNKKLGTKANPIEISNIYQLLFFQALVNEELTILPPTGEEEDDVKSEYISFAGEDLMMLADGLAFSTAYYQLTENIDLKGKFLNPIGTKATPFMGTFDGNGYDISNVILYEAPPAEGEVEENATFLGFFGFTIDATITKLSLSGVQIRISSNSTKITSKNFVCGALVGYAQGSTISYVKTEGSLTATSFVMLTIGGVVGNAYGTEIDNSYSLFKINLTQTSNSPTTNVGGIVGNLTNGSVLTTYSQGSISLIKKTDSSIINCGGIVGFLSGTQTEIHNCFTVSNMTLNGNSTNVNIGGIVGRVIDNPSIAPIGNKISYCYFLSNNQTSQTVTEAIASTPTVYPYYLTKIISLQTTSDFFENDENETKWSGLYEWNLEEFWSFNELTYLPDLQLFSDYTITLYCDDEEKYEVYFLDEDNKPIKQLTNTYRIGDKVRIVAEFKYVENGDVGLHYGKYYIFKTWKHAGTALSTAIKYYKQDFKTEENEESEYIRCILTIDSFSSSKKGLYAIQTEAKQVKIQVVLDGEGSYEYDTEVVKNTNKDTFVTRTFFSQYGENVRIKAIKLQDRNNWTFNKWYYASNQETTYPDLQASTNLDLYTRTTLNFKIGQASTDILTSPDIIIGTKDMSMDDEGNGFDLGTLNIIIRCNFTSKIAVVNCSVDGDGDYKFIDPNAESTETAEIDVTKETPTNNIISAVGKKIQLVAVSREGYAFSGWFINDKEVSSEQTYTYTIEDTNNPSGVVINIKAVFEIDDSIDKGNGPLLWILIGSIGGVTLIGIVTVTTIIIVKKKRNNYKKSVKTK